MYFSSVPSLSSGSTILRYAARNYYIKVPLHRVGHKHEMLANKTSEQTHSDKRRMDNGDHKIFGYIQFMYEKSEEKMR